MRWAWSPGCIYLLGLDLSDGLGLAGQVEVPVVEDTGSGLANGERSHGKNSRELHFGKEW